MAFYRDSDSDSEEESFFSCQSDSDSESNALQPSVSQKASTKSGQANQNDILLQECNDFIETLNQFSAAMECKKMTEFPVKSCQSLLERYQQITSTSNMATNIFGAVIKAVSLQRKYVDENALRSENVQVWLNKMGSKLLVHCLPDINTKIYVRPSIVRVAGKLQLSLQREEMYDTENMKFDWCEHCKKRFPVLLKCI